MLELLLELDVSLLVVDVVSGNIQAGSGVLVVGDNLPIFVAAVLRLLYKEEVLVTPNVARGGHRRGDALGKGARNWGGTTSAG